MLDQALFQQRVAELQARAKKRLSDREIALWYSYLSGLLTTEQFKLACDRALLTSNFMPTAEELARLALGTPPDPALMAWLDILDALDDKRTVTLDGAAVYALQKIGGMAGLERATLSDRLQREATFKRYYQAAKFRRNLPDGRTLNAPALAPSQPREADYAPPPKDWASNMQALLVGLSLEKTKSAQQEVVNHG